MLDVDHAGLSHGLMPALLAAGACLLRCRAQGVVGESKADGSPVSRADREAEAIILAGLAAAAPGVPVIAEEAVSAGQIPAFGSRGFEDRVFLVDALDGTREYLGGGDDFTVNVALVVGGAPVFGMVLAPAIGRLFVTLGPRRAAAARVEPSLLEEVGRLAEAGMPVLSDIATRAAAPEGLRVLTSRSHRSAETDALLARLPVARTEKLGSSLKFGIIAAGEADVYPRLGPTNAWDIAAGHAVLAAAGGMVTTLDGRPLSYLDRSRLAGPEPFLNPSFVAWGRASMIRV